jgi:hypothetical protein
MVFCFPSYQLRVVIPVVIQRLAIRSLPQSLELGEQPCHAEHIRDL